METIENQKTPPNNIITTQTKKKITHLVSAKPQTNHRLLIWIASPRRIPSHVLNRLL